MAAIVYLRIGGVGVRKIIYECGKCGAAVTDTELHDAWHEMYASHNHEGA